MMLKFGKSEYSNCLTRNLTADLFFYTFFWCAPKRKIKKTCFRKKTSSQKLLLKYNKIILDKGDFRQIKKNRSN